jgi:hypothetical protein
MVIKEAIHHVTDGTTSWNPFSSPELSPGEDRPMSNLPTQLTAFGQASTLVVLLDALGGVVISDGERASSI